MTAKELREKAARFAVNEITGEDAEIIGYFFKPEQLQERDEQLCREQREICIKQQIILKSGNGVIVLDKDLILNAPMPET